MRAEFGDSAIYYQQERRTYATNTARAQQRSVVLPASKAAARPLAYSEESKPAEASMPFDFQGKRVVVCGGSRGIGRSIALGFAHAGAAVSICARGTEDLAATRAELTKFGSTAHAATCDLADGSAVGRYIAEAASALVGIDILVNNASGFGMSDDEAG